MAALVAICIVLLYTGIQEADCVSFNVTGGLPRDVFPCREKVILKCVGKPGSNAVRWQIDYNVHASSDASALCDISGCTVYNNFSGRYSFTYDKPNGISSLTISTVTSEDDKRGYRCDDFQLPSTFNATVKTFPSDNTTTIESNMTLKTVTVSTGCTFNVGNVTFSWYKLKDGDRTARSHIQNTTATEYACPSSSACNGTSLKSTISTTALENIGGKYSIECKVLLSDTDAYEPVVKILDDVINSGGYISQVTGLSIVHVVLPSVLVFRTIYWSI